MPKGGNLTFSIRNFGGSVVVTLKGDMRDDLSDAIEGIEQAVHRAKTPIVFDCAGLREINSRAIAQWVEFMASLQIPITFTKCSSNFVHNLNMIPELIGAGKIESFLAPYECEDCSREFEPLFEVKTFDPAAGLPDQPCPKCGKAAGPVVDRNDFVAFLT